MYTHISVSEVYMVLRNSAMVPVVYGFGMSRCTWGLLNILRIVDL